MNKDIDKLKLIRNNFYNELVASLYGLKTSIPFISQSFPLNLNITQEKQLETIVIGGSIYSKTLFNIENNEPTVISNITGNCPIFKTSKIFFNFIDNLIIHDVNNIVINFAYPLKPILRMNKFDGILISGKKENEFEGLINKAIGEEIEKYIFNTYKREINISIINDAVCILLSGLSPFYKKSELVGGVIGTGINFSFFINNNKEIINTELGNFSKFTPSKEGKLIDLMSERPGSGLIEKEISGAYLYKHFNMKVQSYGIIHSDISSTLNLSKLINSSNTQIAQIAKDTLNNSAQLVAALMSGIIEFKKSNITFIMEGNLFWKGQGYKETIQHYIKKLSPEYTTNFIHTENSSTLGALKLFLN